MCKAQKWEGILVAPQLGNCPKCGKLFLRVRNICDGCYQKQEDDFLKVSGYLRDHSGITIKELSDGTGISVAQIRQYIWAGRIIADHFPNLTYPCEMCGNMIGKGKKCLSCLSTLNHMANQIGSGKEKEDGNNGKTGATGGYISKYL